MALQSFRLPDPGEGLTEAEVVTWRVAVGDTVRINDVVVEIETAKSLVELPVPFAGTVTGLLVEEGATVEVGTPIITIDDGVGGVAADSGASPVAVATAVAAAADAHSAAGSTGADDARAAVDPSSLVADEPDSRRAHEPGMVGSPAPKLEAAAAVAAAAAAGVAADDEGIEEGKIGGTTSTGRTAVLVGYGVKQTEAKRRPRKASGPAEPPSSRVPTAPLASGPGASAVEPGEAPVGQVALATAPAAPAAVTAATRALAKPPVRKLAKDLGIDLRDVTPSGAGGIVTRADVEAYVAGATNGSPQVADLRGTATSLAAGSPQVAEPGGPAAGSPQVADLRGPATQRETRIPVKGVRKMTAQAMVGSAFTAPHVTMFNTVDVTATMQLVARLKADREFANVKVSPMLVLAKALLVAIRRNPGMNAVWDEAAQEIVVKGYVNLGIAAATPRGLVVPNVKDADAMSMLHLAQEIGALTETARAGRTQPAQMSGGTITITNVGVFGIDTGTPIINPGESAIVAFGAVRKQPWVVTDAAGDDQLAIRQVTTLAVSFDHRLIDGELGSRFLADLSSLLEDPSRGLVWG